MKTAFSFFLIFCAILASCVSSNAQTAIGRVIAVDKAVVGKIGTQSRPLVAGEYVHEKELITTDATGLGQFEISDGTRMVVGPNSKLVIDSILYNRAQNLEKFVLSAAAGAVRFISGSGNSSAYKINTPVGVLGLRGTAFDFHVLENKAYVMLLEGQVRFCGQSGRCKTLTRKCDYLEADLSGAVSDPKRPASGPLSFRDRRRIFPFISSQRKLRRQFRLKTQDCRGAASRGEHGGGSGGNGQGGTGGPSGGGAGVN